MQRRLLWLALVAAALAACREAEQKQARGGGTR